MSICRKCLYILILGVAFLGFFGIRSSSQSLSGDGLKNSMQLLQQYYQSKGEDNLSKLLKLDEELPKDFSPKDVTITSRELSNKDSTFSEKVTDVIPPSKVFGTHIFRSRSTSNNMLSGNINIATPDDYQIGPNDEIILSISGLQTFNYKQNVSLEGLLNIKTVGAVAVGGLTISAAKLQIKQKMIRAGYTSLANGKSDINISLGNIRSIRIFIMGEVLKPGAYNVSSLITVFNALFMANGPSDLGSFRHIQLIRDNKLFKEIDLYDFLMHGDRTADVGLKEMDIIYVPLVEKPLSIEGAVIRPKTYELNDTETLQDLVDFAAGFAPSAHDAYVKVFRESPTGTLYFDVPLNQLDKFEMFPYDEVLVEEKTIKFSNYVNLQGAIYRPGKYAIVHKETKLKELLLKSGGLKPIAYKRNVVIFRTIEGEVPTTFSVNLQAILDGEADDVILFNQDKVIIPEQNTVLQEANFVIQGEVKQPGSFVFANNLKLIDALLLAGGVNDITTSYRVEISSRYTDGLSHANDGKIASTIIVDDIRNSDGASTIIIKPYDVVTVYKNPNLFNYKSVYIEGEIFYPGDYTITSKIERVADLISRAGGITNFAHLKGAYIKRHIYGSNLNNSILPFFKSISKKDSLKIAELNEVKSNGSPSAIKIPLNLEKILRRPSSSENITLSDRDTLIIPKMDLTVKVSGEVHNPTILPYAKGKGFRYYFKSSGGVNAKAKRTKTFVIYANGKGRSSTNFIFFTVYPRVLPGSEIIVPPRDIYPYKIGEVGTVVGALTSGLTSLALIYTTFFK